ncbi:MAG: hypothetical protein LBU48_06615 [Coriobacteriales bacterium]|jgi:hypothetical protein|nr:hypothetical protein [Coriobacteriales bacterium]
MFFRKKKPVKKLVHGIVSHNAVFGAIRYSDTGWYTKDSFPLDLFGKTYHVTACARADAESKSEIEPINEEQERAIKTCFDIFKDRKAEVEQVITDRFKMADATDDFRDRYKPDYDLSDIASRFEPDEIDISRDGHCALYVADNAEDYGRYDDWDAGFALSLIPDIKTYSREFYLGHIDCLDSIIGWEEFDL